MTQMSISKNSLQPKKFTYIVKSCADAEKKDVERKRDKELQPKSSRSKKGAVAIGVHGPERRRSQNTSLGNEENEIYKKHNLAMSGIIVDKDDPRSRLHFIKYSQRDGKTTKIWECGICSKEFRHQYTLMRHLPTHTDERNFKCDACGKAFRQLSTLSQHKAIHSDARPYICFYCKKTFNRVSTLISHKKTHSENKPHKCNMCGKGFHQKGNLRNHVFTHTNERPYKCKLCGRGFNQMSNLVCHKVKAHAHTEKMPYVCSVCEKEFPRRYALREHEESKHGIKYRQSVATNPKSGHADKKKKSTSNSNNTESVRIVRLPDGPRKSHPNKSSKEPNSTQMNFSDIIFVDKINTKAMECALMQNEQPFALLKPVKGVPILVKIELSTIDDKHALMAATPEDLQMTGNLPENPTLTTDENGVKTMQVKVPIVATITQKAHRNGQYTYIVEPPDPTTEEESLLASLDSDSPLNLCSTSNAVTPMEDEDTEDKQEKSEPVSTIEECTDILELAAESGIQFVRATEDGRYEIMSDSEARELMRQNPEDVTVFENEIVNAINQGNNDSERDLFISDLDSSVIVLDPEKSMEQLDNDDIEFLQSKDIQLLDGKDIEILQNKEIQILDNEESSRVIDIVDVDADMTNVGPANELNVDENIYRESALFSQENAFPESENPRVNEEQHYQKPSDNRPIFNYPKSPDLGVFGVGENPITESRSPKEKLEDDMDIDLSEIVQDFRKNGNDYMAIEANCQLDEFKVFSASTCEAENYLTTRYQDVQERPECATQLNRFPTRFDVSPNFDCDPVFRHKDDFNFRLRQNDKPEHSISNDLYEVYTNATLDLGIVPESMQKEDLLLPTAPMSASRECSFDNETDDFLLFQVCHQMICQSLGSEYILPIIPEPYFPTEQGLYQPYGDPAVPFLPSSNGPNDLLGFVNRPTNFEHLPPRFEEPCKEEQCSLSLPILD